MTSAGSIRLHLSTMANYSRWEDIKKTKGDPSTETRATVEQDLDLGQLIYDMRTKAGLSQRELAERMEPLSQSFRVLKKAVE